MVSDEPVCMEGMVLCPSRKSCMPPNGRCDGYVSCADASDEYNCGLQGIQTFLTP